MSQMLTKKQHIICYCLDVINLAKPKKFGKAYNNCILSSTVQLPLNASCIFGVVQESPSHKDLIFIHCNN